MNEHVAAPLTNSAPAVNAKYFRWFLIVALLTTIIDQISKVLVRHGIAFGEEIPLLPGWVHLSHVLNYGAAWGMLSGRRWLLIAIAFVVISAVIYLAREMSTRGLRLMIGLGLVLGGAIGNLIDRILFGAVTDFIDMDTPWRWLQTFPVFNGADSALTIGVILLLIDLFLDRTPAVSS
jgi:signal peptidase II